MGCGASRNNRVHPLPPDGALPPLDGATFARDFCEQDGRVRDLAALCRRVFRGGVSAGARAEVWPRLLGVFPPGASSRRCDELAVQQALEYTRLRAAGLALASGGAAV